MCLSIVRSATRRFRRILVLELADAAYLAHAEMAVALPPDVERGLADAELAADVADRRSGVRLAERVGDLLLRELRLLYPVPPRGCEDRRSALLLYF
jgi:hypothetical protein